MRKGDCSMRINLLLFATNDLNSFDGYFPNKASKYCSIVTFIINSRILITNPSSCALLVVDRRTADTDTEIIKWLALVIDAHLKYMWNLMNQPVIDKVITKMHRNCIYIDWHTYWHGEVDQKIISEISISSPKNLGIKRGILPVKKIVTYSS